MKSSFKRSEKSNSLVTLLKSSFKKPEKSDSTVAFWKHLLKALLWKIITVNLIFEKLSLKAVEKVRVKSHTE